MQGLDELGFLPGWGNTAARVRESFQLLLDIVQVRVGYPVGGRLGPRGRHLSRNRGEPLLCHEPMCEKKQSSHLHT